MLGLTEDYITIYRVEDHGPLMSPRTPKAAPLTEGHYPSEHVVEATAVVVRIVQPEEQPIVVRAVVAQDTRDDIADPESGDFAIQVAIAVVECAISAVGPLVVVQSSTSVRLGKEIEVVDVEEGEGRQDAPLAGEGEDHHEHSHGFQVDVSHRTLGPRIRL